IVRDATIAEPQPPPAYPGGPPMPLPIGTVLPSVAPSGSASASKPKKNAPSAPVLKTHTLIYRPPLDPKAPIARLNATDANLSFQRRSAVVPVLGTKGEVSLLVMGEQSELHVAGDKIATLPLFDARRYYYGDQAQGGGLVLSNGRLLVFGSTRRR